MLPTPPPVSKNELVGSQPYFCLKVSTPTVFAMFQTLSPIQVTGLAVFSASW